MMKNLVVLFAGADMRYALSADFDGNSAFTLALLWAREVAARGDGDVVVFTIPAYKETIEAAGASAVVKDSWTNADIAAELAAACTRCKADYAVYAWADSPFLNAALTAELVQLHTKYKAEYSFADGFAYGLTPEVVDKGAAAIIAALGRDSQKAAGGKRASRDALFSIMSGDINSFEIETLIADKDYRMLRLSFDCGSRATALACTRLYAQLKAKEPRQLDAYALSDLAEKSAGVLQTLPAFYNVQLAARYRHQLCYSPYERYCAARAERGASPLGDMPFERFSALVADIAATSERAVVSLSLFGEPLLHPRFADCVREVLRYPQLTAFIETDGTLVTEALAAELAALERDASAGSASTAAAGDALAQSAPRAPAPRVIWCVLLDAADAPLYAAMHGIADSAQAQRDFAAATAAVATLTAHFPHAVYPQLTRMKANEAQLETFYRYWKKADSPSLGELVIQKYDWACGAMGDEKSADLSPLERFPCWHLRRDLCVLSDGSVPVCRSAVLTAQHFGNMGNVFSENIQAVWQRFSAPLQEHIDGAYDTACAANGGSCKACDEYYTFNF